MCGSLCVFVNGWPKRGSYLRHLRSGTGVSRPSFVYFGVRRSKSVVYCIINRLKTTQRAVPAKTCETRERTKDVVSLVWDSEAESQRFRPKTRCWSVGSKLWVQSSRRAVWGQKWRHRAVKTMTRSVSIFGSCVAFLLSYHDGHEHAENTKKYQLHLLTFCSSESVFYCLFLPPSFCCFLLVLFLYNLWNAHIAWSEKK